jgi:SAM-dependent methyltransferase
VPRKPRLTARNADKHVLYQNSVQSPEEDVRFFSRRFKKLTGKPLRLFREDFCGTARLCCEFVKLHRENRSLGVDLHGPTLGWARRHNLSTLTEQQRDRVSLIRGNVLHEHHPRVQLTAALNFSYWVFKTRPRMLAYLKSARRGLVKGGVFLMDVYGGAEAQTEQEESTEMDGFSYVWDQDKFDPVNHHVLCKIHYEFRDGSRMRNAFVYDWRMWTLPELQELMVAAGFRDVHILWETTDLDTNEGTGNFRRVVRGHADPAWIAYVVGIA